MSYIVRREGGRYTYLYECRSYRPGNGKGPVSERVFIGRIDRETREFIPKKYYVTETLDFESGECRLKDLPKVPACYLPLAAFSSS